MPAMLKPDSGKLVFLALGAVLGMWVLPKFLSR